MIALVVSVQSGGAVPADDGHPGVYRGAQRAGM
jgi:hypothetical protein